MATPHKIEARLACRVVENLRRQGVRADDLLKEVSLRRSDVADPEARVPYAAVLGLIERAALRPNQVPPDVLRETAETGVFRNASDSGFQEGYYPWPGEIATLLRKAGFEVKDEVSLKSVAYRLEKQIVLLDEHLKAEIVQMMADLSRHPEIIATSGHVLVVAGK